MARRPINYKTQQLLQRQTSVKSNDSFPDERLTGLANLRVPSHLSSPASDYAKKSDRTGGMNSPHSEEGFYPAQADSLRTRDQLSPRDILCFEQNFSGHSSVPAVSRVSQQPSFESYDSSVSANSWASSNEPEAGNAVSHSANAPVPIRQSTSLPQASHMTPSRLSGANSVDPGGDSSRLGLRDDSNTSGGMRIRINLDEVTTRQQRYTGKSGEAAKHADVSPKGQSLLSSGNCKRPNDTLKIIGSEKDSVSDIKLQVAGGTSNIKGLWKRAFQSLRKDKSKREPSLSKRREPPTSSDEVDPVYHLLRCAASKSQSTAIATSGLGTPRALDRTKPNTMESPLSRRVQRGPLPSHHPTRTTSLRIPRRF